MPKKVLIALPPAMLEQCDVVATNEHRTRSDLIREALRRYLDAAKRGASLGAPVTMVIPPAHSHEAKA
jgi:metal-responsive CopG/Arc/MetJ family transcriptional regulator